jgi:hypothetical protein
VKTFLDVLLQIPGFILVFMLPVSIISYLIVGVLSMFLPVKKKAPETTLLPAEEFPAFDWSEYKRAQQVKYDPLEILTARTHKFNPRFDMYPATQREMKLRRESA